MSTPLPDTAPFLSDLTFLRLYFAESGGFISEGVAQAYLRLEPGHLANLGALVPRSISRWLVGYGPGPILQEQKP